MSGRPCVICGNAITTGRRDRKVCSRECHDERARRRAAAWHLEHGDRVEVLGRKAVASRRRYEKVAADPELLAAQRAMTADWRTRSRDTMRAQERAWRAANPEAARAKVQRRRALKLAAFVEDIDVKALWERDGGLCGICDEPIELELRWPDPMCLTVDHVIALADGGLHEPANAQPAHMRCNARKGARVQRP
ncbi:HNH endonuclease [Blastococcus sp. SYSU D00813]